MINEHLKRGIFSENPIFVLVLGLCPSLAISTSLINGIGLGLSTMFVLVCSNVIISAFKSLIPDKIRIPCYIVIIGTFVTIAQLLMKAYFPILDKQLGIFLPLLIVNCIILSRAEMYASKNNIKNSLFDGITIGTGFTLSLLLLSIIRELIGSNKLLGFTVIPSFNPMSVFILAPGGFFTVAFVLILIRFYNSRKRHNQ
jgi:electron transport complex protein RnfE